jgi:hypothetical protein
MRSPPLEVLKTWPKPNYVNPTTRGQSLMVVELTLLPIAMIVVFLRMYVRIAWLRKSWYDDYLMILAMVSTYRCRNDRVAVLTCIKIFSIGTTILVIMAAQLYGWDKHVWDLRPATLEQGRQVTHCTPHVTSTVSNGSSGVYGWSNTLRPCI